MLGNDPIFTGVMGTPGRGKPTDTCRKAARRAAGCKITVAHGMKCKPLEPFFWHRQPSHNQNLVIPKMVNPEPCKELERRPQLFPAGTAPY